jgi:isochorismate pyruvate lyase
MSRGCSDAARFCRGLDTLFLVAPSGKKAPLVWGDRMRKAAAKCVTMADIRAQIDRVDGELVALFAERVSYIDRAAEVKTGAGIPARIQDRVEDVVTKVRGHAVAHGLPPDKLEKLWRKLIDWSIEREEAVLGPDAAPPADRL